MCGIVAIYDTGSSASAEHAEIGMRMLQRIPVALRRGRQQKAGIVLPRKIQHVSRGR